MKPGDSIRFTHPFCPDPLCNGPAVAFSAEFWVAVKQRNAPSRGYGTCNSFVAPLSGGNPKVCARCLSEHRYESEILDDPDMPIGDQEFTLACKNGHRWTSTEFRPQKEL